MTKLPTKPPMKLSATTRAMLTLAATRPDRLVRPPQLPAAAAPPGCAWRGLGW